MITMGVLITADSKALSFGLYEDKNSTAKHCDEYGWYDSIDELIKFADDNQYKIVYDDGKSKKFKTYIPN